VGFAHGFQTLEDNTSVIYFVDQAHKMSHEQSVRYDSIGFDWPHSPAVISEKDKNAPTLYQLRASGQLGV
jgi:dTDP-4-dehydrorhamnose 3,5-epimerase